MADPDPHPPHTPKHAAPLSDLDADWAPQHTAAPAHAPKHARPDGQARWDQAPAHAAVPDLRRNPKGEAPPLWDPHAGDPEPDPEPPHAQTAWDVLVAPAVAAPATPAPREPEPGPSVHGPHLHWPRRKRD